MATTAGHSTPSDDQLRAYARLGAKQELRSILKTFPGILTEVQRERASERAAYARSVKQAKRARHG